MNTTFDTLKHMIDSVEYNHVLEELKKIFKIKILDDVTDSVLEKDDDKCKKAELLITELEKILLTDRERFLMFVIRKLDKFSNTISWKTEQEFYKGDSLEDEDEDEDEDEEILGYRKNFLIIYLIEFFILKNKPTFLERYLISIRVGNVKKYAKELLNIYQNL